MNYIDALILALAGAYLFFRIRPNVEPKKQEAETEAKDTQLQSEIKPVPTVTVLPPPTERPMTPEEVKAYWDSKLGDKK